MKNYMLKLFIAFITLTITILMLGCSSESDLSSLDTSDRISDTESSPEYETYYNASGDLVIYYPQETENIVEQKCTVHDDRYHFFPRVYSIVSQEEYNSWVAMLQRYPISKAKGCNISENVCDFIEYFNISKEEYELVYYSERLYGHHPDVLFSKDYDFIQEYYRSELNGENFISNCGMEYIKSYIKYGIDSGRIRIIYPPFDHFFETVEIPEKYTKLPTAAWTLADFFFDLEFTDEEIICACEAFTVAHMLNMNKPFALQSYSICKKVAELRELAASGKNPTEIKYDADGNPIFGDTIEETIQYYKEKVLEERHYFNYKPLVESDYYDFYNY